MGDQAINMESFIKEAAFLAEEEIRRVGEIRGSLQAAVSELEVGSSEREEVPIPKISDLTELQEDLRAPLRHLETKLESIDRLLQAIAAGVESFKSENRNSGWTALGAQLKEKDELLTARYAELNELRSQLREKESTLREQEKGLNARIGDLENRLRERDEEPSKKEAAPKKLEKQLTTQIRDLKSRLEEKEELIKAQAEELAILKKNLESLQAAFEAHDIPRRTEGNQGRTPYLRDDQKPAGNLAAGVAPEPSPKEVEQPVQAPAPKPEARFQGQAREEQKKPLLASLLGPIKRGN